MPWVSNKRKRRWYSPRFWTLLGIAVIAAVVALLSYPRMERVYFRWQEHRHVRRAAVSFQRGDYRSALLDSKKALRFNAWNPEATRVVAQSLEAIGMPEAASWRRRLDEIKPGDAENLIAWARDAIKAGDPATAGQALRNMDAAGRSSAEYHDLCAAVALSRHDPASAEAHWLEAARLDPKENRYRLNLAALQLDSKDTATREKALETLEKLRNQPAMRLATLRLLIKDAEIHRNASRARDLANALKDDPGATFKDQLTRLSTLRALNDPAFPSTLAALQEAAAANPADLYDLIIWMNEHRLAILVSDWLPKLPAEVVAKPPVCIAVADALARGADWTRLKSRLDAGPWEQLDFFRMAFQSQALKRGGDEDGARDAWNKCLAAARKRQEWLEALAKLAMERNWQEEAEAALWELTSSRTCPRWALDALWGAMFERKDTAALFKLSRRILQADPNGVSARNNFICLALLTHHDEDKPHILAEALHEENPGNVVVASTYALSLYLRGREREAVSVMAGFPPDQLRAPAIALYYGVFLAAIGQADKAAEYLRIAETSPLLPEEKTLVTQARESLAISGRNAPAPEIKSGF